MSSTKESQEVASIDRRRPGLGVGSITSNRESLLASCHGGFMHSWTTGGSNLEDDFRIYLVFNVIYFHPDE